MVVVRADPTVLASTANVTSSVPLNPGPEVRWIHDADAGKVTGHPHPCGPVTETLPELAVAGKLSVVGDTVNGQN
jgi:hypothetical protein